MNTITDRESCSPDPDEEKVIPQLKLKKKNAKCEMIEENGEMKPYHFYYSQKCLADVPAEITKECKDEDREECILPLIFDDIQFNEQDILQMAVLTNKPLETTLRVWSHNNYDMNETLSILQGNEMPQLVPYNVRGFLTTHIAEWREANSKKAGRTEFHFAKLMSKTVNSQMLVQTYYEEKKKNCGDPMNDEEEVTMNAKEDKKFKALLAENKISFVENFTPAKKRGKKRGRTESLSTTVSEPKVEQEMVSEEDEVE
uniref:ELM2 domain-containing protein n=1 Tax=Caenorhabditis tropicalis TaxID=1561998 RepID=A0A1I7TNH0_9PELO